MEKLQLEKNRHSLSHLLAMSVLELYPDAKLAIGPTTEVGFYYDFDLPEKLSLAILPKLEKRMKELIKSSIQFEKSEASTSEAFKMVADQPYKKELIDDLAKAGEKISFYRSGKFTDLCAGPHVANSREIKTDSFKLSSVAGAYWRGDEHKQQLQRIYGVAFESKAKLEEYLKQQAEALKRDHRKYGAELDLFTISPLVGPGLPLFTPRGVIIFKSITDLLHELEAPRGYEQVDIPHLGKVDLYKTSGHWHKYEESIFKVKGHGEDFVLKPMNCPHHMQIYASRPRSWRDLPVRYTEVTKQYRDEQAGELLGLSRVRSISIDDNHIFCRPDQIQAEMKNAYEIIRDFSRAFGLELAVRLSLRDPKNKSDYLGDDATWAKAEKELRKLLATLKLKYFEGEGEASFYAPKIDFLQKDSLGRTWQLSTIQLDFVEPERFKLDYTDKDGAKSRPAILHIAVAGSLERFISILLEHYAGNLPVWLSPVQVQIIPVGAKHESACDKLAAELRASGLRTAVDSLNETVGNKIRKALKLKVPYLLVIGDKEAKSATLHIRKRGNKAILQQTKKQFITNVTKEINSRLPW